MVDLSKLFDSYSRQARLFPGLLTLFPIILTAIALFPRLVTSSWGATLVTVGTSCGLLYGLSVLSRSRGKAVEKRLLAGWGGWPTTIWLRHREEHLPAPVLARYHAFFAKHVPLFVAPNAEEERANPKAADGMYASAVKWLQERCRGKAFPLVEKENAEYGFRRNLRGLKPIGLTACLVALLISALAIAWRYDPVIPAISSLSMPSLLKALVAIKPAAIVAPAPVSIDNAGFSYRATFSIEGRSLKMHREFVSLVAHQTCEPELEAKIAADMNAVRQNVNTSYAFQRPVAPSAAAAPALPATTGSATPPATPVVAPASAAPAGPKTVELSRTVAADHKMRLSFFYEINPDCTASGFPAIRVVEHPKHGKVTIENGTGYTNFPEKNVRVECNKRKSDGVVVTYEPEPGYTGGDTISLDAIFSSGSLAKRRYAIEVR